MKTIGKVDKNLYKLTLDHFPIACVDVVIECNEKFLFLKRKEKPAQGEYWFPGGRLHKNETLEDCVKRKLNEEVGIESYSLIDQIGTFETIFDDGPFEAQSHTINVTYHVIVKTEEIKSNDKFFDDYKWIYKDDPIILNHKYAEYFDGILDWILLP
jgi:colanic acid biosynthesis protein WcaH